MKLVNSAKLAMLILLQTVLELLLIFLASVVDLMTIRALQLNQVFLRHRLRNQS